ncbi:L-threonylcarbamoyladenylate synthase [Actinotalea caeni]|uniref:L-threonylcarbamoyladenylate synthase n=1 Tax=Actinotalea caeni TaxID=1348467 RepID=UPI00308422F0
MTVLRDCTDDATWWPHVDEATRALAAGGLVVLPTDTVYGIAADAFKREAVQALLDAKGRGRDMPPPVLIGDVRTMDGLADDIPDDARELATRFWPGPLTIILKAQPSLQWDLGETRGTVALRMPDHELALAVLKRTGPLAVSSANTSGSPAATTAQEAADMLGSSVRVYLDGGPAPGGVASTIVDATGPTMRIVRAGALSAEELGLADADEPEAEESAVDRLGAEEAGADGTAGETIADAGTTAATATDDTATDDAAADAAAAAPKAPAPARTSRAKAGTAAATTKEGGETDAGEQPSAKPARAPRKPRTTAAASEGSSAGDEAAARPVRARKPRPRADAVAQAAEAAEAEAAETSPAPRRARRPRTAPAAEETPVETPEP